jgi:hypothetical protein
VQADLQFLESIRLKWKSQSQGAGKCNTTYEKLAHRPKVNSHKALAQVILLGCQTSGQGRPAYFQI